jgi:hypothetical protein
MSVFNRCTFIKTCGWIAKRDGVQLVCDTCGEYKKHVSIMNYEKKW